MKITVFGASGKTGALVVEMAKAAGHDVVAFVHNDDAEVPHGVAKTVGDALDEGAVRSAISGRDAVVDAIGGSTPWRDAGLETRSAQAIIAGMKAEGARRLVAISALGVGDSADQTPFVYGHLLMPTMLRGVARDKARMENEIDASGLDFVIARPAALVDDPADGKLRVFREKETAHHTRRGDLAKFLVDQLESDEHLGLAVVVAND